MAAPASTTDAIDMFLDGLGHLATLDPTALAAETQARCIQALEQGGGVQGG